MSSERQEYVKQVSAEIMRDLERILNSKTRNCLNCVLFTEGTEQCERWHMRPPARVIAHGCDAHEDEIPF